MKKIGQKLLSIVLVITVILGMVATLPIPALAAGNENSNIFDELGFSEKAPDERPDMKPYGSDQLMLTTVNEYFIADMISEDNAIHGMLTLHNSNSTISKDYPYPSASKGLFSKSVAFSLDPSGKKNMIATYTVFSDKLFGSKETYSFFIYIIDPVAQTNARIYLESINVEDFEEVAEFPWSAYVEITAGDFDGDGYDEIIIPRHKYVRNLESIVSNIGCLKYIPGTTPTEINSWEKETTLMNYGIFDDYDSSYFKPFAVGDLNSDGIDDFAYAATGSGFDTTVFYGQKGQPFASIFASNVGDNKYGVYLGCVNLKDGTDIFNAHTIGLTIDDINGDGQQDIIRSVYVSKGSRFYKRIDISTLDSDGNINTLFTSPLEKSWGTSINAFEEMLLNSLQTPVRVEVVRFSGFAGKPSLVVNGDIYQCQSDDSLTLLKRFSDIDGGFEDAYFDVHETSDVGCLTIGGTEEYFFTTRYGTAIYKLFLDNDKYKVDVVFNSSDKNPISFALPDTDNDSVKLTYKSHYFTFSDPKIYAALASPPYFKDLIYLPDGDAYSYSETSFASGSAHGSGSNSHHTITAGAYVRIEAGIDIIVKFQCEIELTTSIRMEFSEMTTTSKEIGYSTYGGTDAVAMYAIPLDVFVYEAQVPTGVNSYTTKMVEVYGPNTPVDIVVPLDVYTAAAQRYGLPDLDKEVFTHELGYPGTYPTSAKALKNVERSNKPSKSMGGTSINQTFADEHSSEKTYDFSTAITTRIGAGIGGVSIGAIAGYEGGGGFTKVDTTTTTYSGSVYGLPMDAYKGGYNFTWELIHYTYESGGQCFPVITYLVTDVSQGPTQPDYYDIAAVTDSSITLGWEASRDATVQGYDIFEVTVTGSKKNYVYLGSVSASDRLSGAERNINGTEFDYKFTDDGLADGRMHTYVIQTVRNGYPRVSVYSDELTAVTKAKTDDISIAAMQDANIHPDQRLLLSTTVRTMDERVRYKWQRLVDGKWEDLGVSMLLPPSGVVEYLVTAPSIGDSGYYRLFTARTAIGYLVPLEAYSNVVKVTVTKYTPELQLTVADDHKTFTAQVTTAKGGPAQSGSVIFEFGENTGITVPLGADGKAVLTLQGELPPGAYNLIAQYVGNRTFDGTAASQVFAHRTAELRADVLSAPLFPIQQYGSTEPLTVKRYSANVQAGERIAFSDLNFTLSKYGNGQYNTVSANGWFNDESITPQDTGRFKLQISLKNDSMVLCEYYFDVGQRLLEIVYDSYTCTTDNVISLSSIIPAAAGLAAWDTLSGMGFETAILSAGIPITPTSSTPPGVYLITENLSKTLTAEQKSIRAKYNILISSGQYTLTAPLHTVSFSVENLNDMTIGGVTGSEPIGLVSGQSVQAGTQIGLVAQPNVGYAVKEWTVNGTTVQTGGNTFQTTITGATDIKVIFSIASISITIAKTGNGVVTNDKGLLSGDEYMPGRSVIFTAKPDAGWNFKQWKIKYASGLEDAYQGTAGEDGTNTLSFTMPSSVITVTAEFFPDNYTLTLDPKINAQNKETGAAILSGESISGGTAIILSVPGYTVDSQTKWQRMLSGIYTDIDGTEGSQIYEFIINSDESFRVDCTREAYATVWNAQAGGSIVASVNGIAVNSSSETAGGSNIVLTASPIEGYIFTSWQVNGGNNGGGYYITGNSLIVSALSADLDVTAVFTPAARIKISIMSSIAYPQLAGYKATVNGKLQDVINGELEIYSGSIITLHITPPEGMEVMNVTANGISKGDGVNFALGPVSTSTRVVVSYAGFGERNLTVTQPLSGGKFEVYLNGQKSEADHINLTRGTGVRLLAIPDSGKMLGSWYITVDGQTRNYGIGNEVVFSISGNTEVTAEFVDLALNKVAISQPANAVITPVFTPDDYAGEHVGDNYFVRPGASAKFSVLPDQDYQVTDIIVEGSCTQSVIQTLPSGSMYIEIYDISGDISVTATVLGAVYSVNTEVSTGGVVHANLTNAAAGETVTLSETSDRLYDFISYVVVREDGISVPLLNDAASFIMPASNVAVHGVFAKKQCYIVSVTNDASKGTVTGAGEYLPGDAVTIAANAVNGYSFDKWNATGITLTNISASRISFIMPANDVHLASSYSINQPNPGPYPSPNPGPVVITDDPIPLGYTYSLKSEQLEKGMIPYYDAADGKRAFVQFCWYDDTSATLYYFAEIGKVYQFAKNPKTFADIESNWAKSEILFSAEREIFNGVSDGLFDPSGTLTRAMMITVMARLAGVTEDELAAYATSRFTDVGSGAWYLPYIEWAAEKGIVEGVGNNRAEPERAVTRAEMATLVNKLIVYLDLRLSEKETAAFSDIKGHWAKDSIEQLTKYGILTGKGGGIFDPAGTATRAESAAVVQRLIEYAVRAMMA